MHMNARTRAHNTRAHTCKRAHITRTYTYIVRTPNNNVKNTSPTITKKVLRNSLVIVIIPLLFFCLLRLITFHEVSVLCRQNYPGIYSRVVLPVKRAGSKLPK